MWQKNLWMIPLFYWHEDEADFPPPHPNSLEKENGYETDNDNKCFIGEKRKIKSLMKSGWALEMNSIWTRQDSWNFN